MKLIVAAIVGLALSAHGQTAKVIALSPADAAEAQSLYAQRDAINKKIEDMQKKIANTYLSDVKPGSSNSSFFTIGGITCLGCSAPTAAEKAAAKKAQAEFEAEEKLKTHLERKQGWQRWEFSEDFKFIVPVTDPPPPSHYIGGNVWPVLNSN